MIGCVLLAGGKSSRMNNVDKSLIEINNKTLLSIIINKLKLECLDLIGVCYASLGQKPDKEQMKGMAQLFYNDIINYHTNLTMQEIAFAINKGLRKAEDGTSVFINVRTWSVWLKDYKSNAIAKRRQNQITDFELHKQQQKQIASTINKAKRIK